MAATITFADEIKRPALASETVSASAGVLLMGTDYRALGVARSLGRRGIPVWAILQGGHFVAATSRYVSRRIPWPEGGDQPRIDLLLNLSAKHGLANWMLFPTDDYTVALASRHHEVLASHYRLTVPPWKELESICDKRCLHQLAQTLGIHEPWTVWPFTRQELASIDCPFPVILKPAIRTQPNTLAVPKAWRAEDRASLLARYEEATRLIPPENLILQEVVPGGGEAQFSYAALCKEGSSLASLVARRTRQFPKDFGQFSTFVETVDEPGVIRPAERLIAVTNFTGLMEIEFKKDPRDGQFKVFDMNPRVWGWHTLSSRAGVDFSHLFWLLLKGEPVPELRGLAGKRWMHATADFRVALEEILSGRLSLWDYLRSFRSPLESAIFAWDDPLPGFLDLPLFAWTAGKRIVGQ